MKKILEAESKRRLLKTKRQLCRVLGLLHRRGNVIYSAGAEHAILGDPCYGADHFRQNNSHWSKCRGGELTSSRTFLTLSSTRFSARVGDNLTSTAVRKSHISLLSTFADKEKGGSTPLE